MLSGDIVSFEHHNTLLSHSFSPIESIQYHIVLSAHILKDKLVKQPSLTNSSRTTHEGYFCHELCQLLLVQYRDDTIPLPRKTCIRSLVYFPKFIRGKPLFGIKSNWAHVLSSARGSERVCQFLEEVEDEATLFGLLVMVVCVCVCVCLSVCMCDCVCDCVCVCV